MPAPAGSMSYTVGGLLEAAKADLTGAGIRSAATEAEILVGHLLKLSRTQLYAAPNRPVNVSHAADLDKMVAARCSGRPLQYITGVQAFRRLAIKVGPGVLVPRPETELLVERALELLHGAGDPRIADIGAGSGAIALSLATERPDCRVWATEISEDALQWARTNHRLSGAGNVELLHGDLFAPLPQDLKGKLDLVVSNPPYLSEAQLGAAPADVRDHEPAQALVASGEGTAVLERIIAEAPEWLRPGGWLALETGGSSQWDRIRPLMEDRFERVAAGNDLAGVPRLVEGRRP